jgi:hypothetical protein
MAVSNKAHLLTSCLTRHVVEWKCLGVVCSVDSPFEMTRLGTWDTITTILHTDNTNPTSKISRPHSCFSYTNDQSTTLHIFTHSLSRGAFRTSIPRDRLLYDILYSNHASTLYRRMSVTSIRLELERDSGVFYGGEVVRGTVRLTTTGEVKCRGFHFKLVRRLNTKYSICR